MLNFLKYSAVFITAISIVLGTGTLAVYGIGGEGDCVADVKCPSGCEFNYIQCYTSGCDDSDCEEATGGDCVENHVSCLCYSPIPMWAGGRCGDIPQQ